MEALNERVLPLDPDVVRIEPSGPPRGEVRVQGAKNSALPLIAAAVLAEEGSTTIENVPCVRDVQTMLAIVRGLGASVVEDWSRETVTIDASRLDSDTPDPELVSQLRGSLMLMAPLLSRLGSVRIARPGGCAIGERKYNLHLAGLQALGAEIRESDAFLEAVSPRLQGARFAFESPTHTGTQQLILAAAMARGTTVLSNASREPEVGTMCRALEGMGARISGIGGARLTITGVDRMRGTAARCSASRLETSFFAMVGCLPGGRLTIVGASPYAWPSLEVLAGMGAHIAKTSPGVLEVVAPSPVRGCRVSTRPYPGFPTDAQAHLLSLACFSTERSIIRETLYEDRFRHVESLIRMGADIQLRRDEAVVRGRGRLTGTDVDATDLQAGAALLLAGLGADGVTRVHGYHHVLRGYPHLIARLATLGTAARLVA